MVSMGNLAWFCLNEFVEMQQMMFGSTPVCGGEKLLP